MLRPQLVTLKDLFFFFSILLQGTQYFKITFNMLKYVNSINIQESLSDVLYFSSLNVVSLRMANGGRST
jgi:hypothetical protein